MYRLLCYNFLPLVLVLAHGGISIAQSAMVKPRTVPVGLATFKKGDHYLKVTYGRPSMKTELNHPFGTRRVPYRKLWRTGDDDATELTTIRSIRIGGQEIPAGTYSLFTVPDTAEWKIILNKEVGMWGTFTYKPDSNIVETTVPVYKSPKVVQEFTLYWEETEEGVDLVLVWDRVAVRVPFGFEEL